MIMKTLINFQYCSIEISIINVFHSMLLILIYKASKTEISDNIIHKLIVISTAANQKNISNEFISLLTTKLIN